jgi:hypothetical protein
VYGSNNGISLYSYLYLKLGKQYVFLIISYIFSSTKSENKREKQVQLRSMGKGGRERREVAQTMHTHVSKCKNDKKETK